MFSRSSLEVHIAAFILSLCLVGSLSIYAAESAKAATESTYEDMLRQLLAVLTERQAAQSTVDDTVPSLSSATGKRMVPFYSQFLDITSPSWQGVGCGIAATAMLIDYYTDASINVDELLDTGITRGAFLADAGWTHAGLIGLARDYGLDGESRSLSGLTIDAALSELKRAVAEGPVMVSVHYTFEPTNPIPHLVVVNGIVDDTVFYNDPAEATGNGSLSIDTFARAWKKRYIELHPVS